jgi:hypothetical protein
MRVRKVVEMCTIFYRKMAIYSVVIVEINIQAEFGGRGFTISKLLFQENFEVSVKKSVYVVTF